MKTTVRIILAFVFVSAGALGASAGDLRITIPKRTKPTPVQQFNQAGVKAVEKHQLEKAEQLFYRAYLLDPDDPFTLNNLGYTSELEGKIERAERYYELSAQQKSETLIDQSSIPELKGQQLSAATRFAGNQKLRTNRSNLEAMSLLQEGRTREAEEILLHALATDPQNPFTLNNLGYTMEAEGNLESAQRYYTRAADLHSAEPIVVALDPHWRGKAISEVAADNARAVSKSIEAEQNVEARAARLNAQGVFALNHNDPRVARTAFEQAYKLDPQDSFALNNMGYVSEMNGDQETAGEFYAAARRAPGARRPVTAANHSEMKGLPLGEVAAANSRNTEANLQTEQESKRRQGEPIELKRRDHTSVTEPQTPNSTPPQPPTETGPASPQAPRPPEDPSSPSQNEVPRPAPR
jgi:Flp pilus assembly protein TadD